MKIVKRIRQYEILPAFYGVAWVEFISNEAVCLPVPLNVFAALGRSALAFLRFGWRPLPVSARDAYMQGLADARRQPLPLINEDDLEHLYWCFDAARAKTGDERLRFKEELRGLVRRLGHEVER